MSHKPVIIDLEQGSEQWHEYRDTRIGASDTPILLELSPWSTPRKLWEQKQHITPRPDITGAMQRGIDMEPIIRAEVESKFNVACLEPVVMQHPDYDYIFASIDGWDREHNIVHEFKAPSMKVHEMALRGEIPEYYLMQIMQQMFVAGCDKAYYHTYHPDALPDEKLATVAIESPPDAKTIKRIIKACTKFYEQLQTFTEPDATAGDFVEHNDTEWLNLAKELIDKQSEAESALRRCDEIKLRLQELAGDNNAIGGGVRVCRFMRKGNVQYKEIPELSGVDLDQYRSAPKEHWRVSIERSSAA